MKPRTKQLNRRTFRVWFRDRDRFGWRDVSATAPDGAAEVVHASVEDSVQVYDVEPIRA